LVQHFASGEPVPPNPLRYFVSLRGQTLLPSDKKSSPRVPLCPALRAIVLLRLRGMSRSDRCREGATPPTPLSACGRYASTPFAGTPRNAPSGGAPSRFGDKPTCLLLAATDGWQDKNPTRQSQQYFAKQPFACMFSDRACTPCATLKLLCGSSDVTLREGQRLSGLGRHRISNAETIN